ncbi:hypothetical protein [Candidatus Palauibacter sp.]|uniref:hypothetical protein n=1 Tax=Candidatus Palauibacter sp. TaxID=3101350 RepID=UPI003AF2A2D4
MAATGNLAAGQERRWLPAPVESAVFQDIDGALFGSPQRIKGTPEGGFLVDDWGEFRIRAFSASGQPLWTSGGAGEGPGEFSGVEPIPFPKVISYTPNPDATPGNRILRVTRIDPEARRAVRSVTAGPSRLFVLFEGHTERASRIVDTYAIADGAYAGSYLLPHRVVSIATLTDGRLATLEMEFVPTVRLWTLPSDVPRR